MKESTVPVNTVQLITSICQPITHTRVQLVQYGYGMVVWRERRK